MLAAAWLRWCLRSAFLMAQMEESACMTSIWPQVVCGGTSPNVDVLSLDGGRRRIPTALASTYCLATCGEGASMVGGCVRGVHGAMVCSLDMLTAF